MSLNPLVSVIIPAYNAERFISEAVKSALAQNYAPLEVIVVDDGSSDGTAEAVREFGFRVRYLFRKNAGVAAARNTGIELARGEYLAFLDADDIWVGSKLQNQIAYMEQRPEVGLIFGDYEEFTESAVLRDSFLKTKRFYTDIRSGEPIQSAFPKLLQENFIPTSTVVLRRRCLKKTGLFNPSHPPVEDRDMWLRVSAFFPLAGLPQIMMRKRLHEANISADHEAAVQSLIRVLEENRRLFGELAHEEIWDQVLARWYRTLSYVRLRKNEAGEARRNAWQSLRHAWTSKAFALFVLSFFSRRQRRWLSRSRKRVPITSQMLKETS